MKVILMIFEIESKPYLMSQHKFFIKHLTQFNGDREYDSMPCDAIEKLSDQ